MKRVAACALLIAAGQAAALRADIAGPEAQALSRVLSAVQVDLIAGDDGQDRAMLLASTDPDAFAADLVIFAGQGKIASPHVVAPGVVYLGPLQGQAPWLEVAANGSLQVHSQQVAIGRQPWEMTLTLAEREGEVLVAGLSYAVRDRLTGDSSSCDWNLLSGDWVADHVRPNGPGAGAEAETDHRTGSDARRVSVTEWAADGQVIPDFCQSASPQ